MAARTGQGGCRDRRAWAEAAQAGQLAFGMSRAISADPFQAILGRQSGALGYGAQQQAFTQQLGGQAIGPRAVDYGQGVNLALQNQANLGRYQTSIYGAQTQAAAADASSKNALLGSLLGAAGTAYGGYLGRG